MIHGVVSERSHFYPFLLGTSFAKTNVHELRFGDPCFKETDIVLSNRIQQKDLFITGWWYTYHSEKYDIVNWDDDIPSQLIWENKPVMFQSPPTSH